MKFTVGEIVIELRLSADKLEQILPVTMQMGMGLKEIQILKRQVDILREAARLLEPN